MVPARRNSITATNANASTLAATYIELSLKLEFEIENVFDIGSHTYIMVRQITAGAFSISPGSKLGDIPLAQYLEQPRIKDKQGNIREDLFVFCSLSRINIKPEIGTVVFFATEYLT